MLRNLSILAFWLGACVPTGDPTVLDGGPDVDAPCGTCPEGAPLCDLDAIQCVECLGADDCTEPGASRCDPDLHQCVPCRTNNVSDCDGVVAGGQPLEICDQGTCIACRASRDCAASAPVCSVGQCVGCSGDADCGRFPERSYCVAGACSECTATDPDACAPGTVCDLVHGGCLASASQPSGTCAPCVNDLQCAVGSHCVQDPDPMRPDGYLCLPEAAPDCEQTRLALQVTLPILGGDDVVVCAPRDLDCPALAAHGTACTNDAECGASGGCIPSDAEGPGRCAAGCERQSECRGAELPADLQCRGHGSVLLCQPSE